ncbi:hypothetical protein ACTHO0_00220 [Cytobacillus praedii]|uniref:hypothetical protein n=1 Tax=Cytobacillus praedii TaxID=1742358 RepID=UPI003F815DAD
MKKVSRSLGPADFFLSSVSVLSPQGSQAKSPREVRQPVGDDQGASAFLYV